MSAFLHVHSLWITRKSSPESYPELLVAWDEYGIEENFSGWEEACSAALAACGDDVAEARYITLRVPHRSIEEAFKVPVVDAFVERPS